MCFKISILFQPKQNRLEHGELPNQTIPGIRYILPLLWREDAEAWKMIDRVEELEVIEFGGNNMEAVKKIAIEILSESLEPAHIEQLFQTI